MNTLNSSRWHRMLTVPLSALLMVTGLLFSGAAFAQTDTIVGSAHDFSSNGWANGEICIVCHTPHAALSALDAGAGSESELGPLWNRALTQATFSTYSPNTRAGSDINATGFGSPTGVSKLCLSCHDGSIAIDSFGGGTGGVFIDDAIFNLPGQNRNIGEEDGAGNGDLSNDHPVAFTFPTIAQDAEIAPFDIVAGVVNGLTGTEMPLFGSGDQMECATCHDVHATGTYDYLLRVDNTGSGLCLNCHDK